MPRRDARGPRPHRVTLAIPRGDGAASASIGLAVAAIFVVGAFSTAILILGSNDGKDPRTQSLDADAATALELLVKDPGLATGGSAWASSPDSLLRFGLAQEGRPQFLDYSKVRSLWNASDVADGTNGAPDYEEVKAALGLDAALDFHLRSYPVLLSIDDARWQPEGNLKVAYFAHYAKPTSPASLTPAVTTTANSVNVTLDVKNLGVSDMVYVAAISLGDAERDDVLITEERHTRLVRPGDTERISVDFWKLKSWDNDIDGVKIAVTDAYGNRVVDASTGAAIEIPWFTGVTPPTDSSGPTYHRLVHAANVYYTTGQTVEFVIDHYEGDGTHVNNAKARFVLVGPDGNEWVNTTAIEEIALPSQPNKVHTFSCTNCTDVGNYTAIVWDSSYKWRSVDRVHVSAATMFNERLGPSTIAIEEMQVLRELVAGFDATVYDAVTNADGDVFVDDSNHARDMIGLLGRYTTVIIGSEVEQANLAPEEVKQGLADWVANEGGNLVVLGTYREESRWLRSVWGAMQQTAGGGISAPDSTHPVLSTPERLSYERYLDRGRAWTIPIDGEFTHVLTRGEDRNGHLDTLAVSSPGAFDSGTVVLTSYMPGSLTQPQDRSEAKRFMNNMLNQGHSMLFIDFGPPIPDHVPVGSASRLVIVPHPNIPDMEVEVRLVMYLFG